MKKNAIKILTTTLLILTLAFLTACSSDDGKTENTGSETSQGNNKVTIAAQATSGQVFQYLAEENGYLEEEGIEVEVVYINNGSDAFSALSAGQVDIISTYGTGGPLMQIANGQDFTIFGGYMVIGATPVFALPETEYNDVQDFKGKTIAIMRGGTPDNVLRGILYNAGFDLNEDVEFLQMKKNTDVIEAVRNGQADFGAVSTGFELQLKEAGLNIVMWPDEIWPDHSCCKMVANTDWLANNEELAEKLLRAYIKAERDMKNGQAEKAVDLIVNKLDLDKPTVESFVYSEHMKYDTDPYRHSVKTMWDMMHKFDYISDTGVNIDDHINNDIYGRALKSLLDENPEDDFYKEKWEAYESNNL